MITRLAPTPSGYLHLGNAVNFQLIDWLAATHGGRVVLRIDDMDGLRVRSDYVDDIFDVLRWLEIGWSSGPTDRAAFDARFTLTRRTEYFRGELFTAVARGLDVYACVCSRSTQRGPQSGGCAGRCWDRGLTWDPGRSALRARVPVGTAVTVGGRDVALDSSVGDFVLWRRDNLPAYQLASVVLDRDLGVTHIVRGLDLLASSAAQFFLAEYFAADTFRSAMFIHHELVRAPDGEKLSKSQQGRGNPLSRSDEQRAAVREAALLIGGPLGIGPQH